MTDHATILIVEDERIVAADIAAQLRQLGYTVAGMAASAEQALATASATRPDLVLMDVRLRGPRDGIEAAAELRERFAIPVVFLSASTDDGTIERARRTLPYGYLVKPFRDRELRSAIEVALHRHELEVRLEAVLVNIKDAVALLDDQRRLVLTNPAYVELFDLDARASLEASHDELVAHVASRLRDADEALPRFLALASAASGAAERFELAQPRRRILRVTVTAVRVGSGRAGYLSVWHDETAQVDLEEEREHRALTDPLTGLANRRAGDQAFTREQARSRRDGTPLSVAVFDLDWFKAINDQHGHATGDAVLCMVTEVLRREARATDVIVRWGGEEFVALLPGPVAGAASFCERARAAVAQLVTPAGALTISGGVAEADAGDDLASAVARADGCLLQAKRGGRNRICAADG